MESDKELKDFEISKILDNLAVRILRLMQSIVFERQYLDDSMKDGFLKLAKSRYLMRGQKINTFQIDTSNLQSKTKVYSGLVAGNGGGIDVEYVSYEICHKSPAQKRKNEHINTKDGLRNVKDSRYEECKNEVTESNEFCNTTKIDPLNWFGVLVPKSLKDCQSSFERVIETSVTIATLQNHLKVLLEKYKKLKSQKTKLLSN